MITLRELRWPSDRDALLAIDTSFTTEHIRRVVVNDATFTMHEATVSPPLTKTYNLSKDIEDFSSLDLIVVAERGLQIVRMAALNHDTGDERAILRHLYVHRPYRGQGIGHKLMDAMIVRAKQWQARCLWLETQDVNYKAIRFYENLGIRWCGLDLSLDERTGAQTDETAVFFMLTLE